MRRRLGWVPAAGALAAIGVPGLLTAQARPLHVASRQARPLQLLVHQYEEVPAPDVAYLGTLGGVVACLPGAFVGGATHYAFRGPNSASVDAIAYVFIGCWAGASIGLAGATHLANRRRGDFWLDLAASLGVGLIGLGVIAAVDEPEPLAVAVPIAQIIATVATEKWAEHR